MSENKLTNKSYMDNEKTDSYSDLINKNNPKIIGSNIENLLWGFNPNELLNEITFPNEKEEFLIRRVKRIRDLAVKSITLSENELSIFLECFKKKIYYPILDFINTPEYSNYKNNPNSNALSVVIDFCNNLNVTIDFIKTFEEIYNSICNKEKTSTLKNEKRNGTPQELDDMFNSEKQLLIFLSRSAASITIQSFWRMYITRKKYFLVMYGELSYVTNTNSTERNPHMQYLPSVDDLSVQEQLIQKYRIFCSYYENKGYLPPDFPQYCAVLIQKNFKRYLCQTYYKKLKSLPEDIRNNLLQNLNNNHNFNININKIINIYASMIQKAWRSYYNRKIFKFYKYLIRYRENGNPCRLLKYINPLEAQLIDSSFKAHIRFRLGGYSFPPIIYYKIYIHKSLIDINSFSPRDYTKIEKPSPHQLFCNDKPLPDNSTTGWYTRVENNGWRPIADSFKSDIYGMDEIEFETTKKTVQFHHLPLKRKEDVIIQKKKKKIEWLRKIYQIEKNKEYNNINDDTILDEYQQEENDFNLIKEWSDKLKFEDYVVNWKKLATTDRTEKFNNYNIIKKISSQDKNYHKVQKIQEKIINNNKKDDNTEPIKDEKTEFDENINKLNDINIKTIENKSIASSRIQSASTIQSISDFIF
ncbi:hypothetical protein BCR32DRAFT_282632 [Anaeromyces robustus]|uniref:Uncharacterized protein n=1 Tax=Anaeromyces robustus TaxID=1754192 RepID=A0A1Y1WWZ5_9FUNG|nr:hypothetical protein BCR32DRAFT_282632 [Anaeromyces robustus]|eukprot:ORX78067.1 hypothetical protein BCR32DRAFT_282632 [Anaeromyces robustus]